MLNVKNRILIIRIIDRIKTQPEYAKKIGLYVRK